MKFLQETKTIKNLLVMDDSPTAEVTENCSSAATSFLLIGTFRFSKKVSPEFKYAELSNYQKRLCRTNSCCEFEIFFGQSERLRR